MTRGDALATDRVLVWTFQRIIARFCSPEMTSSYLLRDSTVLPIPMSRSVDCTRSAKTNSKCRRRICAWTPSVHHFLRVIDDLGFRRFTRDQVPVSLTLYLKWQLEEPLKLATHGYETPYDALRDKTQSILTQIVAHRTRSLHQARRKFDELCAVDYSSMVKQRSIGGDGLDEAESSSQFLDALRTHAMDDLHTAALEYGIILKDLAVIDRQFKGKALLRLSLISS